MAELYPYPFPALADRMFSELDHQRAIFDLPEKKFFLGDPERDFSVDFHGKTAASPLGPAAGPHSQMAQNLVLSWLGGARIMELKTVQIMDELEIPRPCIDMRTVGFNVEWSQELKLMQSLDEYVKGAMLIEMLKASGKLPIVDGFESVIYDMSVGYDLQGIKSEPIQRFLSGMLDARPHIDRLRSEIPDHLGAHLRDLDFPTRLANSLTLSTFHGCPPDEIESIIDYLMREIGIDCIIKFNPTLLGESAVHELLHDRLGYTHLQVPSSAFEKDTSWPQAVEMVERLSQTAQQLGVGFGVKFSNTLIVENATAGFLPESESEVYLSGLPLHVLAISLVSKFRRHFRDRFPISFAAGIDARNYSEAVALGLVPITVCSDLLKPGGYGRLLTYHRKLAKAMADAGDCSSIDSFVVRAAGNARAALEATKGSAEDKARCLQAIESNLDLEQAAGPELFEQWVSQARLLNTETYLERLLIDRRYAAEKNSRPPRKIGSHLEFFDCISCDKCIPVCPNDANFIFDTQAVTIPVVKAVCDDHGNWTFSRFEDLRLERKHQIANFADFCNECGNCDVFCPEDGGPYVVKPRFFGSLDSWQRFETHDGFFFSKGPETDGLDRVHARFDGAEFLLDIGPKTWRYRGHDFDLSFDRNRLDETLDGTASGEVDFTFANLMDYVRSAVLDDRRTNYVNVLNRQPKEASH